MGGMRRALRWLFNLAAALSLTFALAPEKPATLRLLV